MGKKVAPTVDEWREEWQKIQATNATAEGMTTDEIAAQMGKADNWVRNHLLRPAAARGELVVSKRLGRSLSGSMQWFTVYRLVPQKGQKKR